MKCYLNVAKFFGREFFVFGLISKKVCSFMRVQVADMLKECSGAARALVWAVMIVF